MTKKESLRVGVLFGGRSGEHEVSLASARNVMDALSEAGHSVVPIGITQEGRWLTNGRPMERLTQAVEAVRIEPVCQRVGAIAPSTLQVAQNSWELLPQSDHEEQLPAIDVLFPVLHGPYGEDGTVQGLLEMANLPYVGCGVLASALAMDKAVAKQLFIAAALPQVAYQVVLRRRWQQEPEAVIEHLEATLSYPLFVKPANLGSSVGISKVKDREALIDALAVASRYDRKIVVEQAVVNAREIEVSVLGNDEPIASIPGEIIPGNEFYDYEAKYINDSSELLIPAPLTAQQSDEVRAMAIQAFQAVDGTGLSRVDFLLDDNTGAFYLNEVNTLPGFTRISMYPKLWEASGMDYPTLVNQLVELAMERHSDQAQNMTTRKL